jgi:hypothetical protein
MVTYFWRNSDVLHHTSMMCLIFNAMLFLNTLNLRENVAFIVCFFSQLFAIHLTQCDKSP